MKKMAIAVFFYDRTVRVFDACCAGSAYGEACLQAFQGSES